ncbi:MAG: M48 family metallopeptidase [Prevotellaceae bacterium]|nr:M48 family metallopeptidase [Prevotellaceae bacterium]
MKNYDGYIEDEEFGRIRLRHNKRARHFIFRFDEAGLVVTTPTMSDIKRMREALASLRPKLRTMFVRALEKKREHVITPDLLINEDLCRLEWVKVEGGELNVTRIGRTLVIAYPESTDFDDDNVQKWLTGRIENHLMRVGKIHLPPRLRELARKARINISNVSVRRSHSRWGSCNAKAGISLSAFLVLLPPHLRDFVMLHELCHTREMNHGPRFHAMLNTLTNNKEEQLNKELRSYTTSIFFYRQKGHETF